MSTVYLHSDRENRGSWIDRLKADEVFAERFLRLVLTAHLQRANCITVSEAQLNEVQDCDIHITEMNDGSIVVELGPSH